MVHQRHARVLIPKIGHAGLTREVRGSGTLLLDGGRGGGHSYESVSELMKITNRDASPMPPIGGAGLGKNVVKKLENLKLSQLPKSKKPKNSQFNL